MFFSVMLNFCNLHNYNREGMNEVRNGSLQNCQFSSSYFNIVLHGKIIQNFRISERKKKKSALIIAFFTVLRQFSYLKESIQGTNQFFLQLNVVYFLSKQYSAMAVHMVLSKKNQMAVTISWRNSDNVLKNKLRHYYGCHLDFLNCI